MKKFCLACSVFLFACSADAQTTLYFQGFEGSCSDNWSVSGTWERNDQGGVSVNNKRTGTYSARVGRGTGGSGAPVVSNGPNTLTMNPVTLTGYSGVVVKMYLSTASSFSGSGHGTGTGFDTDESATVQFRLNSGAWTTYAQVSGFSNYVFGWATSPIGAAGTCNYSTANPILYNVPAGTTTLEMRVFSSRPCNSTASNYDRADEGVYVDDIQITTTSSLAVVWNGSVSTDWFCAANWTPPVVPVSTTSVTIDQTASNACVVGSAGAVCASIALSSNNGTNNTLTVQNSGTLVCGGNVTVTKSAGSGNQKLTLLNSATFTCNDLTLTGSGSGQENAQLENEVSTSVIATINGNMTINNGGKLDLTNSPNYGILHIKGDYINNGLETDFKQTGSYVHFDGTGTQNINTNNFTEIFSNIVVNKSAGTLYLQDNIEIENQLNVQAGPLNLNAKTATVDNGATTGIIRTSGYVISENTSNSSKLIWQMGSTTGSHVFPFGKVSGYYIPFTFNLTAGTIGNVTVSTYSTAPDNTPYPVTPNSVNDVDDYQGNDNSANTVDRFWQIDKTGASGTATLTFTYDDAEVPSNGEANMVAQRYADNPIEAWQVPLTGQSANAAANTVTVPGVTTFSPWTLSGNLIVLPADLIDFRGIWLSKTRLLLNWQVASQTDVDHYVVEKSSDGKSFALFNTVSAIANQQDYSLGDGEPAAVNYYSLYSVDKNGYKKYMRTIVLVQPDELSDIIETQDAFYVLECKGCKAEVVDISGKVIHTTAIDGSYEYAKHALSPGIYFLKLRDGERTITKKFVVF